MKTRRVKYLHEDKGSDVLLFEEDLYAIMIELAKAKDPIEIDRLAKANIYTGWNECEVSQELWNHYKTELTGSKPLG